MGDKAPERQAPVTDKRALVAYFEAACKPPADFRIGTEHEKFAYALDDCRALPYDGGGGIRALLESLAGNGWRPVREAGNIIALKGTASSITLEPGGQVELSGAPLDDVHATRDELMAHLAEVRAAAGPLGAGFLGLGFQPRWPRAELPWMPMSRYAVMRRYLPSRGAQGMDAMLRTCTVQCNLDYASEADMVTKFRVGLALQPLATALFATSPFAEGRPSGYVSRRSRVWQDVDPDRCGILPFVFDEGMGFERWVDFLLDVPMLFVHRDGRYIDAAGQSFRDFMAGRLPALPGERPTLDDWENHVSTLFPEARLKTCLEMRGADCGPPDLVCALPAFWAGLMYDADALHAAHALVADWTVEEHHYLRQTAPVHGLNTVLRGRPLADWARDVLALAHAGLRRRGRLDARGRDERVFLEPLDAVAGTGRTVAEDLLDRFHTAWGGDVAPVFRECAL